MHFRTGRAPGVLAGLTLAVTMLGACDGANLFGVDPVTQTNADRTAPVVELAAPVAGSVIALKDSVRVIARVTDNQAIAFVEFSGFALRGDPALGTQQKVSRFGTKRVTFTSPGGRVLTDTTVARDLIATADSIPETGVFVVATAQDTSGNISADTVLVSIGGPRVRITTPSADSTLRAGSTLTVRVAAEDRIHGVASVRVRTSGVTGFARDTTFRLALPQTSVDTVVVFAIPASAQGNLVIDASAASSQGGEGRAPSVGIRIAATGVDQTPPRVSFNATIPSRLEVSDSISVRVTATDEIRVDTIGATVLVIDRPAGVDRILGVLTRRVGVAPPTGTVTIQFPLSALNLSGLDTLTTRFEVIAFAKDGVGNCATATAPNVVQSAPCRSGPGGATVSDVPGATSTVFLVRGRTIPPPAAGDSIADLISDGTRVFASNRSRNRVEVLSVGSLSFAGSVLVGSRPYGLALSPDRSTLLVANSGGAGSISRIPLSGAVVPAGEDRARRIVTDNVVIHVVRFRIDESSGRVNLDIERREYSDLPRFLAQTVSGNILYGTIPTEAAPGGTVQNYSEAGVEPVTDVFVEYAVSNIVADQFVVRRADRVERIIQGTGQQSNHQLRVCDHRPGDEAASICFPRDPAAVLTFQQIQDSLKVAGTDVVFDFSVDPNLIALSDTTFLAVSGDHRTVAVGEGGLAIGRVLAFADRGSGVIETIGQTRDLVDNASDRVVGLALNPAGSVGAARGNSTYFFNRNLRKLGDRVATSIPTGGLTLHPNHDQLNPATALAFISGRDAAGRPVIDVIDSFNFRLIRRVFIRDDVIGSLIAVPISAGGATIRLYGITRTGIVVVDLTPADLQ